MRLTERAIVRATSIGVGGRVLFATEYRGGGEGAVARRPIR